MANVFLAEDNDSVREVLELILLQEGHGIPLLASNKQQALEMAKRVNVEEITVAIIGGGDLGTGSKRDGLEVGQEVIRQKPNIGILATSGFTVVETWPIVEQPTEKFVFLMKPFSGNEIREALRALLK